MTEKEKKQKKDSSLNVNWDGLTDGIKSIDGKIKNVNYMQFLTFEKMYSLSAIKFVYWIGIAAILISSLVSIIAPDSFGDFLLQILLVPVKLLGLRLACEMFTVMFGIYERLGEIKKELGKK